MSSSGFLVEAVIFLAAAVIAVPLFKRLGLGSVLGYLIAGILIGPHALQLIADPERVLHFAEFGVVLLLFLIGLELEPEKVWALRKRLFGLGGLQLSLTVTLCVAGAMLVGAGMPVALLAATGIAMSSTAIGLASLEERHLLRTSGGQASFAVLLFQDLAVVPILMLIALLAPQASATWDIHAFLLAVGAIAFIIAASRFLRPLMRLVAETGMREIFVAFSLLLVIGVAMTVQAVGLSMALGTFLAGVLLAGSEYRYELRLDIEPVKGLLLGLFFIAVGMSVDVMLIARSPEIILGLALGLVLLKGGILYGIGRLFRLASRDAWLFAAALSQVGEFAFVIFGVGLGQGTLDRPAYDVLNAVVALSMMLTPLLLMLYDRLSKGAVNTAGADAIDEENPVIVAGFGRYGQIVGRVLLAHNIPATLIDKDPGQVELMRSFGWRCYYGDASRLDLLMEAGIAKARLFVIALDDPHAALETAQRVKSRWPHVPMVVRARSRTDAFDFRELGLDPIRETFYSALEAARQSLVALDVSPASAKRIVRQFERHDRDMLERTLQVRHDRAALISMAEQGRQDLKALLAEELGATDEGSAASTPGADQRTT